MDLVELKKKFRHRSSVDIKDVEIAMKAVPFLVREIEKMEERLAEYEERIDHLSSQLNRRRPPLDKNGKKNRAVWEAHIDEDENCLYFTISGELDYHAVKMASNCILTVLPNLREGYHVVNDFNGLRGPFGKRVLFHLRKLIYNYAQTGIANVISIQTGNVSEIMDMYRSEAKAEGFQSFEVKTLEDARMTLHNVGRFLKA